MGIDGLLNLLKPIVQRQHISTFQGQTIAVDALPWLYKGCYSYTFELNQQIQSNDYMYYIFQMIDLLKFYQIKPILVFDGRSLEYKSDTLEKRKKLKEENKEKGFKSLEKDDITQARKYFSRCIEITQRILSTAMNCLRTKSIDFMVAPYQADSQIAKLLKIGVAQSAISQDSDLLLYESNVIYKLNQNGQCDYINMKDVNVELYRHHNSLFTFLGLSIADKIEVCILAGCDYINNLKGMGIRKSIETKKKNQTIEKIVEELLLHKIYFDKVPENYCLNVRKVKLIFLLAKTYNTVQNKLEYLNDLQKYSDSFTKEEIQQIVGQDYDYTQDIRLGRVDCKSLQKREVKVINFKELYIVNKNNLLVHQVRNKLRKSKQIQSTFTPEQIEEAKAMEAKEKERLQKQKKQQEQAKKQKRLQINTFLNSLIKFADEQDSQSVSSIQIIEPEPQQQQSSQPPYYKLNPFAKR